MNADEALSFHVQVGIWGAAWFGDLAEVTAMLAESRSLWIPLHPWDHARQYLREGAVVTDEGVTTLPYRYALPFAADYLIRSGLA